MQSTSKIATTDDELLEDDQDEAPKGQEKKNKRFNLGASNDDELVEDQPGAQGRIKPEEKLQKEDLRRSKRRKQEGGDLNRIEGSLNSTNGTTKERVPSEGDGWWTPPPVEVSLDGANLDRGWTVPLPLSPTLAVEGLPAMAVVGGHPKKGRQGQMAGAELADVGWRTPPPGSVARWGKSGPWVDGPVTIEPDAKGGRLTGDGSGRLTSWEGQGGPGRRS